MPHRPRSILAGAAALVLVLLVGCSSAPKTSTPAPSTKPRPAPATPYERDGAHDTEPPDLDKVPDAEPRVENIRNGGPNKTYTVMGVSYTPQASDAPLKQRGLASWYGRKFHGRDTASGEPYDMYAMTAAHKTMPLPSYARVKHLKTGREIVVRVNDRGPFHANRVIDLSYTAAKKLGVLRGVAMVEVERLTNDEIQAGTWRRNGRDGPAGDDARDTAVADATDGESNEDPRNPDDVPAPRATRGEPAVPVDERLTTPVSVAPTARDTPRDTPAAEAGWWLQLGAFRQRDGAEQFQRRVAAQADWLAPQLAVVNEPAAMHKLQAGPYASKADAQQASTRVREALQLVPVIVERR